MSVDDKAIHNPPLSVDCKKAHPCVIGLYGSMESNKIPPPIDGAGISANSSTVSINGKEVNQFVDGKTEHVDGDDTVTKALKCTEAAGNLFTDGKWGWVVAIVAHIAVSITMGFVQSTGLFFVRFLQEFKSSTTKTTLISGVMGASYGISVFVVMQILVGKFQIRNIVMLGGAISSFGIVMSCLARNVTELIFTQSIFFGVGRSMVVGPSIVLVGKYFKTRRALAIAIATSGVSSGSVIFPYVINYLLNEFGLRGSLLIMGGLQLNIIICGALMRSVPRAPSGSFFNTSNDSKKIKHGQEQGIENTRKSKTSNQWRCRNGIFKLLTLESLYKLFGFYLFTNPLFLFIAGAKTFGVFLLLFSTYYPVYVTTAGASQTTAATVISVAGLIEFFSRLMAGYLVNQGRIRKTYMCSTALIISAINCSLIGLYTNYELQLLGAVLYGIFGGVLNTMVPVFLADLLGVEQLAKSLGFMFIIHGITFSVYNPVVGALTDLSGSYVVAFYVIGSSTALAGIILLLLEFNIRKRTA